VKGFFGIIDSCILIFLQKKGKNSAKLYHYNETYFDLWGLSLLQKGKQGTGTPALIFATGNFSIFKK